jgi:hypothetical protein
MAVGLKFADEGSGAILPASSLTATGLTKPSYVIVPSACRPTLKESIRLSISSHYEREGDENAIPLYFRDRGNLIPPGHVRDCW